MSSLNKDKKTQSFSFRWRLAFAKDERLSMGTKHVLFTLHIFMDNEKKGCFPSQKTLEIYASCSDDTIRKHCEIAEQYGYLKRILRGRIKNRGYHYIPLIPADTLESGVSTKEKTLEKDEEPLNTRSVIPSNIGTNSSYNSSNNSNKKYLDKDEIIKKHGLRPLASILVKLNEKNSTEAFQKN